MSILCYHAVDPRWRSPLALTPARFSQHCAWLARNRQVAPLGRILPHLDTRMRPPRGATVVTFDDGFSSVYEHAWPVLRAHGLPATVFLVSATLADGGHPVDWVDTAPPWRLTTLTREQVLEMADGGVQFASHSHAHHDLTGLSDHECERDLTESREILEDILGHPVTMLAYPRGRHDDRVRRAARRSGYTHAFTLPEAREPAGPLSIPRVGVYPHNGTRSLRLKTLPSYVRLRTSAAFPWARRIVRRLGR